MSNFRLFSGAQPKQELWDFQGGQGSGYMGLAATMCVPMSGRAPYCHQMTIQTHPRGDKRVSENIQIFENSIAFGKSTSHRIYPKQHTPKIG